MGDIGRMQSHMVEPLGLIKGELLGDDLLPAVKAAMARERVWTAIFGSKCEHVYTEKLPSLNDSIVPLMEYYWSRERFENVDVYRTGSLLARIILPAQLTGDTNRFRKIAAAYMRWIGGDAHQLFKSVSGLMAFGNGTEFDYTKMVEGAAGVLYPCINLTIPFEFDEHLFEIERPEIDVHGALDADLIADIQTYMIQVKSEEGTVVLKEQVLSETTE